MKRKRRMGHVNHDRWLISYADFITLMFAFFVVLFATGQSDKKKKQELAESIHTAFNQMGIFEAHSTIPALSSASGGGTAVVPMMADPTTQQQLMESVKQRLEQVAQSEIDRGVIGLHDTPDGLVISLQEAGFFDSGAAEIHPSELSVLDRIAAILPDTPLRVEGHTDDVPIHTAQFASNWELSSARASSIARLLLLHTNVHAETMSVAGYAEFHPVVTNDSAEGRARNRRVDIVLLRAPTALH